MPARGGWLEEKPWSLERVVEMTEAYWLRKSGMHFTNATCRDNDSLNETAHCSDNSRLDCVASADSELVLYVFRYRVLPDRLAERPAGLRNPLGTTVSYRFNHRRASCRFPVYVSRRKRLIGR